MPPHLALRSGNKGTPSGPRAGSPESTGVSADALFSLLDGRELIVLGRRFHLDVFSVCELGGCRYIQLSLRGTEEFMLTLRVATGVDLGHIVPRLITWLAHPSSSGEVLEIV
jgi:hypothetical protein